MDIEVPKSEAELREEQGHRLNDLAMAQSKAGLPAIAVLSILRRALNLLPNHPAVISNIGLIYWSLERFDDAREAFLEAIRLGPDSPVYHGNAGVFFSSTGNAKDAEYILNEAIRVNPKGTGPKFDKCLLHLWQGMWDQGLAEYDIRREHSGAEKYPGMPYPLWQGEDLTDKSIYIQGEQGVGDRFCFIRYIAWVKERWPTCRIYSCMNDELINIFWEYREVMEFLPQGTPWIDGIDYGVFLMTLPQFHKSTPTHVPPDPGFIKRRLQRQRSTCQLPEPHLPSLKVAICWTGNPGQNRNADRSIPLEDFLPMVEDPSIALYSVQCGKGQKDIERLGLGEVIQDLGPELEKEGWIGTAMCLKQMDVIVTCCTSIAHLAGALGLNCWTVLCRDPYWIWPRAGSTTLWYPEMRLFRQQDLGNWKPVMAEVYGELRKLADEKLCR